MTSVHIKPKMAVLYSAKNFFIRIIFQGEYFYRILSWFMEISAVLCTGSSYRILCHRTCDSLGVIPPNEQKNRKQKSQLMSKASPKKYCLQL
jgi:hypothetical protein